MHRKAVNTKKKRAAELEKKRKEREALALRRKEDEDRRLEAIEAERLRKEAVEAERARILEEKRARSSKPITVPELGTMRVYSTEQVMTRLGISLFEVMLLFSKTKLRGKLVNGEIFIAATSLELYEKKMNS